MKKDTKPSDNTLKAVFFETPGGNQPVRDFILGLTKEDRREVGADIKAVQRGFPMGLPLVRKERPDIWEIRSKIKDGICRVLFTIRGDTMILLHGFVKKTQKTPPKELDLAVERLKNLRER
jgi:phage-related protein